MAQEQTTAAPKTKNKAKPPRKPFNKSKVAQKATNKEKAVQKPLKQPPKPEKLIERTAKVLIDNVKDSACKGIGLEHPTKTYHSVTFKPEEPNALGRARLMRMRFIDGTTVLPWVNWQTGRTDVDVPAKGQSLEKVEILPMTETPGKEVVISKITFSNGFSVTTTAKRLLQCPDNPDRICMEFKYHIVDDGTAKLSYYDNGKWTGFNDLEKSSEDEKPKDKSVFD
ncbi:MAG: hypothetical protein LUC43_09685, partial [Burkholderiales bacterium]|nr:hypothetical protein [Burkholderiales bacterium]